MEQSTVLKTFLDYVQISSESRSEKTFAKRVENDLRSLGLRVQTDHAAEKAYANTGNVCAFWMAILPLSLFYLVHIWIRYRREKIFAPLWKTG